VSYRDRKRLADIQAAIDAIRSHLQRGTPADSLVFDAVRRGTHLPMRSGLAGRRADSWADPARRSPLGKAVGALDVHADH
jgi:hypothetical protein